MSFYTILNLLCWWVNYSSSVLKQFNINSKDSYQQDYRLFSSCSEQRGEETPWCWSTRHFKNGGCLDRNYTFTTILTQFHSLGTVLFFIRASQLFPKLAEMWTSALNRPRWSPYLRSSQRRLRFFVENRGDHILNPGWPTVKRLSFIFCDLSKLNSFLSFYYMITLY